MPSISFGDERLPERFWDKCVPEPMGGCWLWTGCVSDPSGYGHINWNRKVRTTHRVAYETLVGEVPPGLDLDHLCRVRSCCNPLHLEPVTRRTNVLRSPIAEAAKHAASTHCSHGHPRDQYVVLRARHGRPWRDCRECHRLRSLRTARKTRAARRAITNA